MNQVYLSEAVVFKDLDVKQAIYEVNGIQKRVTLLEGLFQEAEKENRNHRCYPRPILERETMAMVGRIKNEGGIIGEMEHPTVDAKDPAGAAQRASKVMYERSCIVIKEVKMAGNQVVGRAEILEGNPLGATLKSLVESGICPGISSRALGSKPTAGTNGMLIVPDDIKIVTYDIVSDPSTYNARLSAAINEEVEYYKHSAKGYKKNLWNVIEKFV